jgi:hypothetical protein
MRQQVWPFHQAKKAKQLQAHIDSMQQQKRLIDKGRKQTAKNVKWCSSISQCMARYNQHY